MATFRIKDNEGKWHKIPLLGSYTALSECNKAADAAKTAAAEAEESKNSVISNQPALLERIAALEERVQILEGN